ncbi:glycosyltransferase family 4 protein [Nocardioidaceae bacterium]|nr:glycosyltransferase family 4 protein [Nocardioidaceae bacterium]
MRVALLSYRSKSHVGGQGVYVRHLSRELVALGHDVEVLSAQPYPELDPGVRLTKVPSLDLYRDDDPFRTPHPRELLQRRDPVDLLELATMWLGRFPEPRTFALRVERLLRDRLVAEPAARPHVVHDNQTLAPGVLRLRHLGLPLVTTIHHPISHDRRVDLAAAPSRRRRQALKRWYSFVEMQARTARQVGRVLTVSRSSEADIVRDFAVDPAAVTVVPLGVEEDVWAPPTGPRTPGRLVAMASADTPMKGVDVLLRAVAQLRDRAATEGRTQPLELVLVSKPKPRGRTERLLDELDLGDVVRFVSGVSDAELAALVGSAEIACVPSLYEGFSLPTAEAMSCGTPLVVSRAGAIPEVVGEDGVCADLVPPGDVDALTDALEALLADPERRARLGAAGRARVLERFSWRAVARATAAVYAEEIAASGHALPADDPARTTADLIPSIPSPSLAGER